jgi:hypothetical protein
MRWRILLTVALLALPIEPAKAQSVADTIRQFDLLGTWAADCNQPASSDNYFMEYKATGAGEVLRTYYDQPGHVYNKYKIVSATRQGPGTLSYEQVWDSDGKPANIAADRMTVVIKMSDGKFQVVSSQGSDGSYFVKNRKFTSSGNESPEQLRCPAQ